ncbi:FP1 [Symbiodinium sp. CCMP2456]|nr:FP1 [Symbiodinium sp. CCMP2456]
MSGAASVVDPVEIDSMLESDFQSCEQHDRAVIWTAGLLRDEAQKLFQEMTQLRVAVRRLMVAGNGLGDQTMTALSAYLWHSPEPLWELGLADNMISDKGAEELLRCLYNHPSHPPRLPDTAGPGSGSAFALRLDFRNNRLEDQAGLVQRVESAGGSGSVQLYVTEGDGPPPQPAPSSGSLPYLWVFLPRLADQQKDKDGKDTKADRDKKDKDREKKDEKHAKGSSKRDKRKSRSPSRGRRSARRRSGDRRRRRSSRSRSSRSRSRSRRRSRSRSRRKASRSRSASRSRQARRRRSPSRSRSRSRPKHKKDESNRTLPA